MGFSLNQGKKKKINIILSNIQIKIFIYSQNKSKDEREQRRCRTTGTGSAPDKELRVVLLFGGAIICGAKSESSICLAGAADGPIVRRDGRRVQSGRPERDREDARAGSII